MERINLSEKTPPRENQENPQNRNRNPNFRRDPPQNKQRDNNQQIRPPFQENYVYEEERETEELEENHVNLIGSDSEDVVFLTEEEQGLFSSNQTERTYEDCEEYKLGFQNAIVEVHRQYDLRSRKTQGTPKRNKHEIFLKRPLKTFLKRQRKIPT